MRAALLLALAACYTSPSPATPAGGGSATPTGSGSAAPPANDYPPAAFKPPTTGLAVGVAEHVVIDDAGKRLFVRNANGIDILALDSGKKTGHIDLGWDGDVWPAGPHVLAMRIANPAASLEVTLVDPAAAKKLATCSASVSVPPNSLISRVDEFTTHAGTTYLKWETSPPPSGHRGGARMSDEEMDAMNREFQAAYACGLFAIHTNGSRCTLDVASYKDAGLESCSTRSMPWNRYLPTPIGGLALRVDRSSSKRTGLLIDLETLVVSDAAGTELWRLPVETRAMEPPAP